MVTETQLVLSEFKKRSIQTQFIAPWDISIPEIQNFESGVVYVPSNMLNRGSTFELLHRLLILRELERQVGVVMNPVDSMLQYSKEHLTIHLNRLGFPHPRTLVTENIELAYDFASEILDSGGKVVLKPICRGRGIGVVRLDKIRKRGDLLQFLSWYVRSHGEGVFYLQEFLPNQGYDVRVMVVDEQVIGREKRTNPEDFRYNLAAGGCAESFEDSVYDELSIKVAETVNLKITGIDILPTEDGTPYVLEANCFPGYTGLIEATGIQVHEKIVDYLSLVRK
jgi:RimK family alpha-L-glutamate ligase